MGSSRLDHRHHGARWYLAGRVGFWAAVTLIAALVSSAPRAEAEGPYALPQVSAITFTVPASGLSGEQHGLCMARLLGTGGGTEVTSTLKCYQTGKPTPAPPPPPPYEAVYYDVLPALFDPDTGQLTSVFIDCSEVLPGMFAIDIRQISQLDKAGGPASGTVSVIEDTTSPFDCADGERTTGTVTMTPLAQSHDEDQDGCSDWEELGESELTGGLRDPFNYWDFYDTPDTNNVRDGAIAIGDINRVVARFGSSGDPAIDPLSAPPAAPAYHPAFDRGPSLGPGNWNKDAADGVIITQDINAVIAQFVHSCAAAP